MQGAGKYQSVKCVERCEDFTCTNAPRPDDNHKAGDACTWNNMCYAMKRQLHFSEVHKVVWSRSAKNVSSFLRNVIGKELTADICKGGFQIRPWVDWQRKNWQADGYRWHQNKICKPNRQCVMI